MSQPKEGVCGHVSCPSRTRILHVRLWQLDIQQSILELFHIHVIFCQAMNHEWKPITFKSLSVKLSFQFGNHAIERWNASCRMGVVEPRPADENAMSVFAYYRGFNFEPFRSSNSNFGYFGEGGPQETVTHLPLVWDLLMAIISFACPGIDTQVQGISVLRLIQSIKQTK
jgi:hypothetical protein